LLGTATWVSAQAPSSAATATQAIQQGELETVVTVTLNAPRTAVFEAMTVCKHLRQWLRPGNLKFGDCMTQPRVGGKSRFVFTTPDGRTAEVRGVYRVVEEPSKIEYLETYDFSPVEILITGTFVEVEGRTVFTQRLQYRTKLDRDTDFPNIAGSARTIYPRLANYLEAQTGR
jgi:uncharacterized protein YndB with AHSA1/START domain